MRQTLPPDEQKHLRSLHKDLPLLRSRVYALRRAGWTLRAIGEPLKAPRSTVRSWEHAALQPPPHLSPPPSASASLPASPLDVPIPPNLRPAPPLPASSHSTRSLRASVPPDDAARITRLAPIARKVRGGTPLTSPHRLAKQELESLVLLYARRGVPIQRLADLAGVSYRAMKVRLSQAEHSDSSSSGPVPATHTGAGAVA